MSEFTVTDATENLKNEPVAGPRTLKTSGRVPRRMRKLVKEQQAKLPGSFRLLKKTFSLMKRNWKVFAALTVLYAVGTFIFVPAVSGGIIRGFQDTATGAAPGLTGSISAFGYLLSNAAGSNSEAAGVYHFLLILGISLAIIWIFRQMYAGKKAGMRDAFYQGMYPIIPFLLVLLTVTIQALPLAIGTYLYSMAQSLWAPNGFELILWAIASLVLVAVSVYWLCSSIIALYIVCLPNVRPMQALRSARKLVRYRRWSILRRLLFLPFAILMLTLVVLLPLIWIVPAIAGWIFLFILTCTLPVIHGYLYGLYRELL